MALKDANFCVEEGKHPSETFIQIFIDKNKNGLDENGLKVDFVNDIDTHFGDVVETPIYYRTDSVRNILSNKYTALYRVEAKDVADIVACDMLSQKDNSLCQP